MNPNQQQFNQDHHQIYNYLRNALVQLHMQGVPGIHEIIGALNQAHQKYGSPMNQPKQQTLPRNPMQQPQQLPTNLPGGLAQEIQGLQGQPIVSGVPQAYVNRQKGVVR